MRSDRDLDKLIEQWFREDIGSGDHTSFGTIPIEASGKARLLVKEKGVLAGIRVAEKIFKHFDAGIRFESYLEDGKNIIPGEIAFMVHGSVRSILQCERLVLNVMQRMSGIASSTREYVEELEGTNTRILDTRKTTPGMRLLEKEAVRLGGGHNHRFGLDDMVMIKDNHVDFAGGIIEAIDNVQAYLKKNKLELEIVVEARNLDDVQKILSKQGIRRILLDNFSPKLTREAVQIIDGSLETESSGGITRETIRAYAECGVDYVSVGALTHHIRSLDLSLKADF